MNDTIEPKAPRKRASPRTAAKSKSGRKPTKPTSARTKRQRVVANTPVAPVDAGVEPRLWKPLDATLRAVALVWELLEGAVMLIVDTMVRSIRNVKWLPV